MRTVAIWRRTAMAAAVAALAFGTAAAPLHNRLKKSTPKADQVLMEAPAAIRLWFEEKPELAFSRIALVGPAGAKPLGKVRSTDDPLSVAADLKASLPAGAYTVEWRTAGKDGHVIKGSFQFTLTE